MRDCLSIFSPRLSERAASLATSYVEQANHVKIVMAHGDIDFIVAADATAPVERTRRTIAGRDIEVEPASEIFAKKLLYRAAGFSARDGYDLSAAIDLAPQAAMVAAEAARSTTDVLMRRLNEFQGIGEATLLEAIIPYATGLPHAEGMIAKVRDFIGRQTGQHR